MVAIDVSFNSWTGGAEAVAVAAGAVGSGRNEAGRSNEWKRIKAIGLDIVELNRIVI